MKIIPSGEFDLTRSDTEYWLETPTCTTHTPPTTITLGDRVLVLPQGSGDALSIWSESGSIDDESIYVLGVHRPLEYLSLTRIDADDAEVSPELTVYLDGEDARELLADHESEPELLEQLLERMP